MITHEQLKAMLHYNPISGIWTWLQKPNRNIVIGSRAGSIDEDGYRIIGINGERYRSSRLAVFYMRGQWPKNQIDHENNNPDDDSWNNLREATHVQNNQNRSKRKKNPGYKGVYVTPSNNYIARIGVTIDKKHRMISLGTYSIPEDAAKAYNEAAIKYYGEYANLNEV